MKRIGNLYDKIANVNNLYLAEKKARRGKGGRDEIMKFVEKLDDNIMLLNKELADGSYRTGKYYHFTIYEPKSRFISRLPYRDRVVHHAILNVMESFFVKSFISSSYSCIKGRGIHKCLRDLKSYLCNREGTKYCLKLDIRKFYPSVDHDVLKELLRKKIKDPELLLLLDDIIDSIVGLPLGSYTSQWLGNFYLNEFDHWMKETKAVQYYQRYCDDMVILHSDKNYLHTLRVDIQSYLKNNLRLELSNFQVFPTAVRGIDFVGYVCFPSHVKLRKSIKREFKRMLSKYPNKKSMASYKGWLMHADCRNLENKYL